MFLIKTDYDKVIKQDILDTVIEKSEITLSSAENTAQETIESYLNSRYDVEKIFSAEGESRSNLIITYMADIALYHLHSRMPGGNIPQTRFDRFQDATDWLKLVAKGQITPKLPEKPDAEKSGFLRLGSAPKQNHYW